MKTIEQLITAHQNAKLESKKTLFDIKNYIKKNYDQEECEKHFGYIKLLLSTQQNAQMLTTQETNKTPDIWEYLEQSLI